MEKTDTELALHTARRAMKIVIFIGMLSVVLLMISIYVMMTQITASAQLSKKQHEFERILEQQGFIAPAQDKVSTIDATTLESNTTDSSKN